MPSAKAQFHKLHSRQYGEFRYAYPVLSRRSGGVSIGVNVNLDKLCNFDCPYCQVDRKIPGPPQHIDLERLREEVEALLESVDENGVCRLPLFDALPEADKKLRDVALSGDGEPTMIPEFDAVCSILHEVQAGLAQNIFRLVLISNATLFDRPKVKAGIASLLSGGGEVWAKLDAGTEAWYQKVNISRVSLDKIESNLILLGSWAPFKIQTCFCRIHEAGWNENEVNNYLNRLERVRASGAKILEVQLYTLARRPADISVTAVEGDFLLSMREKISAMGMDAKVYGGAD